jgi:hypothetical protein
VIYAKAFFDLQVQFAERVTILSGLPMARVLLEYTNLFIRFGLGHDSDPAHPAWQAYLAGLRDASDPRGWTYAFYLRRPDAMAAPSVVATVGCFAYARPTRERIRLHFQNAETDGRSPLALDRVGARRAELAALFAHVKQTQDPPLQVRGVSWLYNLDAYRRLFPTSYLATAHAAAGRFQHMPLWGQFVDRDGAIKEQPARQFLERLERQPSLDVLEQCFPFQPLAVDAPVQDFYDFYGV